MHSIPHISIVTPVYGCAPSLHKLHERLTKTLETITSDFEIIMVNDASPDNAWENIQELSAKDSKVKGINLSRNFGQHRAITAGLDYANGEWVVVMDCDLQDQPEEIIKLYTKAQEGYDIVWGKRTIRQDSLMKKTGSKLFHILYNYFTEQNKDQTVANFSIVSHKVIVKWRKLREQNRNYPLFINWLGYKEGYIDIEHAPRDIGKSSYTLSKLTYLAIESIVAHSNKPLQLSITLGFGLSFISIFYALYLVAKFVFFDYHVEGWTSLMVSIYFLAGLIIGSIGMTGLYIGKIFDEVKHRPLYIIQDTTFQDKLSQ